jgi:hypothetical protein
MKPINRVLRRLLGLLGFGFYVYTPSGTVNRFTTNRSEAQMWAQCGLSGEACFIARWFGGDWEVIGGARHDWAPRVNPCQFKPRRLQRQARAMV